MRRPPLDPELAAAVRSLLVEAWPEDPSTLLQGWRRLGKQVGLRVALAVAATRPEPTTDADQLALWWTEAWVLSPTDSVRLAAARHATTPGPRSLPRALAAMTARRTRWVEALGGVVTGQRLDALRPELLAWLDGADPVEARHAARTSLLAQTALRRATPAELRALDPLSHASWGDPLPRRAWVARERRLRAGPWPREALETWVLGPGLASCETYRMPWRDGTAWAVASVFTEPALRGHGFASRLLAALADTLEPRPEARALVLFSDVGTPLYERVGFVARPSVDRVWAAAPGDPDDGPWRRFTHDELPGVLTGVVRPVEAPSWPSALQLGWHLDRAHTRAEVARRPRRRPARCGAVVSDGVVTWVDEGDELLVTLFVAGSPEGALALVTAAARTAHATGRRCVRAWDTPAPWPSSVQATARTGAIPMVRPLRPGLGDWDWISRGLWV